MLARAGEYYPTPALHASFPCLLPRSASLSDEHPSPTASGGPLPAGYAVGIVHYRSYGELDDCLASVKRQSRAPSAVVVLDADADPAAHAAARARHPGVGWQAAANRGYAGGANAVLRELARRAPDARYDLLLNPDVVLEPGFAAAVVDALETRPRAALGSGKLLRPGARLLDSAGIVLPRHRRPRDRGSETPDRGQYDRTEPVFGASGAALVARREALEDLALAGEVFDEDFFLYHEDTDLAWRAHRLGWEVLYVPEARAVHGRGWRRGERFRTPAAVRRHSFKNHYLQLVKNERARDFWIHLPVLLGWEALRLGYALLRDPAMLPAYRDAWRLRRRAWHKRRLLQARVRERGGRPGG